MRFDGFDLGGTSMPHAEPSMYAGGGSRGGVVRFVLRLPPPSPEGHACRLLHSFTCVGASQLCYGLSLLTAGHQQADTGPPALVSADRRQTTRGTSGLNQSCRGEASTRAPPSFTGLNSRTELTHGSSVFLSFLTAAEMTLEEKVHHVLERAAIRKVLMYIKQAGHRA